ncbi:MULTISPECIES: hypothetical protein [unclassified Serratia (in: enterobacteria)]|uniref:hypothetical protein n=1 Tax=unclassified Serratia (in: enterobacteria) TaxID=2647522 RepID=UPI002ECFB11C|nr:hypothetical protein [Serratia sp. C2(2)]MEE4446550.1 hypothetical protein [Serratia sp. C2(1)]
MKLKKPKNPTVKVQNDKNSLLCANRKVDFFRRDYTAAFSSGRAGSAAPERPEEIGIATYILLRSADAPE